MGIHLRALIQSDSMNTNMKGFRRVEMGFVKKSLLPCALGDSSLSIRRVKTPHPGPALTAVWSKALPPTARHLMPLLGFESRPGHESKLPVTWG